MPCRHCMPPCRSKHDTIGKILCHVGTMSRWPGVSMLGPGRISMLGPGTVSGDGARAGRWRQGGVAAAMVMVTGEVRQRGDGTVLAALRPCGGEDAIGAERLAAGSREGEACHACRGR